MVSTILKVFKFTFRSSLALWHKSHLAPVREWYKLTKVKHCTRDQKHFWLQKERGSYTRLTPVIRVTKGKYCTRTYSFSSGGVPVSRLNTDSDRIQKEQNDYARQQSFSWTQRCMIADGQKTMKMFLRFWGEAPASRHFSLPISMQMMKKKMHQ